MSMGFSRQGYWSGLPFPSPGDLSNPGVEPGCPALQADSLPSELPGKAKPGFNTYLITVSLVAQQLRNPLVNGEIGSILGSGRSPGEGNGNLLQYFCLGNPTDR